MQNSTTLEEGGSRWLWMLARLCHSSTTVLSLSKVADCICLMALDKPQAVPIDIHVWQIARRDYSWHPNTSQAKGPSPLANKELGEESV